MHDCGIAGSRRAIGSRRRHPELRGVARDGRMDSWQQRREDDVGGAVRCGCCRIGQRKHSDDARNSQCVPDDLECHCTRLSGPDRPKSRYVWRLAGATDHLDGAAIHGGAAVVALHRGAHVELAAWQVLHHEKVAARRSRSVERDRAAAVEIRSVDFPHEQTVSLIARHQHFQLRVSSIRRDCGPDGYRNRPVGAPSSRLRRKSFFAL